MSELYFMTTITDRSKAKKFIELYQKHGVDVTFSTLGDGTAVSETLDSLGLEQAEKVRDESLLAALPLLTDDAFLFCSV